MQAFTNVGYRGVAKVQRKVLSSITSEANRVLPKIDGDGIAAAATAFKTDMLVLCDVSYIHECAALSNFYLCDILSNTNIFLECSRCIDN